jgi:hypothetical protein
MKSKNKTVLFSIIGIAILIIITIIMVIVSKNKNKTTTTIPNSSKNTTEELVLSDDEKPYISLIPQADGHRLDLKITNIPSSITDIEYDLIYTAQDEDLEIEKGVGGTAKIEGTSIERELLLGTESCTNGCKYKFDEGITGGTLTLNFITSDGKAAFYEAPFNFKTSAEIKSNGGLNLVTENFEIKATVSSKSDFFILIKNFKPVYSVFSNGTGAGKVSSISPDTVTKKDPSLVTGDYLIN